RPSGCDGWSGVVPTGPTIWCCRGNRRHKRRALWARRHARGKCLLLRLSETGRLGLQWTSRPRIAEFVGQSYRDSDHKNPETWIRIRRGSQAWECRASATPVVETPFREVVKP